MLFLIWLILPVPSLASDPRVAPMPTPTPEIFDPGIPQTFSTTAVKGTIPLIASSSYEDAEIQRLLHDGAVVLPSNTKLTQPGNVVIAAHSSGPAAFGPYREAFAQLQDMEIGQEFSITTSTAVLTYAVVGKDIVWPDEVNKLPNDSRSTVTLVTCWPRWTNYKRLLVHGELRHVEKSTR
jgi:LPXTG-site transpeptidase (sortase) family protein